MKSFATNASPFQVAVVGELTEEQAKLQVTFLAGLSPREKARIEKGLPFMPGYMLEDDGTANAGVYY